MKTISYSKFIRNTIIVSMTVIVILFVIYAKYIQASSIEKSIKNDAGVVAQLVFQNLYAVMKTGGNKSDLDNVIEQIEKNIPQLISIQIIKEVVPNAHNNIQNALQNKTIEISTNKDHIDFVYPIIFKDECIACHTQSKAGEVASVILMEYPILSLQVSLKEILIMFSTLFVLTILVFFIIWFIFLKKYFLTPIQSLADSMKEIATHDDLEQKITIESSIREIKAIENVFNLQNKKLLDSCNDLKMISDTDSLTGIFNRKKFEEYSKLAILNAKRYNHIFCLVVIDLNKFKFINDNYGHNFGDQVLKFFTQIVQNNIRESDHFFRTGGDEFVLILYDAEIYDGKNVIKKLKQVLATSPLISENITLFVDASFGISEFNKDGNTIDSLYKIADEKMYQEKKESK
jgi:diguanylate cyclase (GGDEF)-like protein